MPCRRAALQPLVPCKPVTPVRPAHLAVLAALRSLRARSSGATAGAAIEEALDDLGEHRRARQQAAAERGCRYERCRAARSPSGSVAGVGDRASRSRAGNRVIVASTTQFASSQSSQPSSDFHSSSRQSCCSTSNTATPPGSAAVERVRDVDRVAVATARSCASPRSPARARPDPAVGDDTPGYRRLHRLAPPVDSSAYTHGARAGSMPRAGERGGSERVGGGGSTTDSRPSAAATTQQACARLVTASRARSAARRHERADGGVDGRRQRGRRTRSAPGSPDAGGRRARDVRGRAVGRDGEQAAVGRHRDLGRRGRRGRLEVGLVHLRAVPGPTQHEEAAVGRVETAVATGVAPSGTSSVEVTEKSLASSTVSVSAAAGIVVVDDDRDASRSARPRARALVCRGRATAGSPVTRRSTRAASFPRRRTRRPSAALKRTRWASAKPMSTPRTRRGPVHTSARGRRVDHHVDLVRLEDPVGQAARVVAAALVVEHRDRFGAALAVAEADLEVCARRRRSASRAPATAGEQAEVEALLVAHDDLVPAAVDRGARLDADEPVAAARVRVLHDLEAAHDAPAVQALVVVAQLVDEVRCSSVKSRSSSSLPVKKLLRVNGPISHGAQTSRIVARGSVVAMPCCLPHSEDRVVPMRAGVDRSDRRCPSRTDAGPSGVAPSVTPSAGSRATTVSRPIDRLDADAEARLDVLDVRFGVRRAARSAISAFERAAPLRRRARRRRDEDREAGARTRGTGRATGPGCALSWVTPTSAPRVRAGCG